MASKIFRFHKSKDGDHWFSGDQLDQSVIEQIPDPSGETHRREVTSIPSPFARLDLIKTAFKEIVRSKDVSFDYLQSGANAKLYHKLVSEVLDIAQIIYNADKLKGKLKVVAWEPEGQLGKMLDGSERHQLLADTLSLFMTQDAETYHFDKVKRFYFIEYDHTIIGGTSPVTLYFSSPNNFDSLDPIIFGQDQLLSDQYRPLHLRDQEFVKYLVSLRWRFNEHSKPLEPFVEFIDESISYIKTIDKSLFGELDLIQKNKGVYYVDEHIEFTTGTDNDYVELFGEAIRKKEVDTASIGKSSDFVIQSSKYTGIHPPLVLQNNFNVALKYTESNWDPKWTVPFYEPLPLDKRILPNQTDQYPYLTISDFLEPYLVKLPYPIDGNKFYTGDQSGDRENGYLLPLTPLFFDFFTSEDLVKNEVELEIESRTGGSVRVKLRVPIKKNGIKIEFSRIYTPQTDKGAISEPDQSDNEGFIVENQFVVSIFPFVRVEDSSKLPIDFRIQLVESNTDPIGQKFACDLRFHHSEGQVKANQTIRAEKDMLDSFANVKHYQLSSNFDMARLTIEAGQRTMISSFIIPKWKIYNGKNANGLDMAVDFGTSNTHIECREQFNVFPFQFTDEDNPVVTLIDSDYLGQNKKQLKELTNIPDKLFLTPFPESVSFPTRTILITGAKTDLDKSQLALADTNIALYYESDITPRQQEIVSNLKWEDKARHNKIHVETFFEQIMLMFRAKILMNNKNPNASKLIWFYPASMPEYRRNDMDKLWRKLFSNYISVEKEANPVMVSESLAPFYYFKETGRANAALRPVVSVDIGGETSDVIIYLKNKAHTLTSFRFAARTLFGNVFKPFAGAETNGFVRKYKKRIEGLILKRKNSRDLYMTYEQILKNQKAEDIISFWFSLEKNIESGANPISFSDMLCDDEEMKIAFLLYYTSLIYHIAQIAKVRDIEAPIGFTFSGTASKILKIITNGNDKTLAKYTGTIVQKVYGSASIYEKEPLYLYREQENAKEVTCKGSLMASTEQIKIDISQIQFVYNPGVENQSPKYGEVKDTHSHVLNQVTKEIEQFMDFFFELNAELNFQNTFGIPVKYMELMKTKMKLGIKDAILEYLSDKGDSSNDHPLEETLFFYPIINLIQQLIDDIARETELSE